MKHFAEAVDPEDRNLRIAKLAKAAKLAAAAHKMATPDKSGMYYAKHSRIKSMLKKRLAPTADAKKMAGYEVQRLRAHHRSMDPSHPDAQASKNRSNLERMRWRAPVMPKQDIEARNMRLHPIRKLLAKAKVARNLSRQTFDKKTASLERRSQHFALDGKVKRLGGIVAAYKPFADAKAKFSRREDRKWQPLAGKSKGVTGKRAGPAASSPRNQSVNGKIHNIVGFVPKKSKVDKGTRASRLRAILRSADGYHAAYNRKIHNVPTKSGDLPAPNRKYPGPDGTMHTSSHMSDHGDLFRLDIERERRHNTVAKFMVSKKGRAKFRPGSVRLRKGYVPFKMPKDTWKDKGWPLAKHGFTKDRKPDGV